MYIVAVYATNVDRDHLLGYVGEGHEHINNYFADRAGYGLRTERIQILDLSSADIQREMELKEQIKQKKAELSKLERELSQ